ncbi:MAG: DUF4430 domain-containing protein [Candidatus Aenigmarchaeota archaeon]|nr:DUF4430 domain-containing protein [Candidatus Aenigmarchaeota archaeon]
MRYDFEYFLFKSDFRYMFAGLILAFLLFAFGTQFNSITGMMISGERMGVVMRIDYYGITEVHELSLAPGTTVFDALKEAAYVEYEIYEEGEKITGIDEIFNEDGHAWTCMINGESVTDFEKIKLRDGDEIRMTYV